MGAWGTGPFDNDDALDFASEITSTDDLCAVLEQVVDDEQMDANLACRIVVVAECVAAMHGHRHKDMPLELANTINGFGKPSLDLYERAREQLAHVISSSELSELWAEAEEREKAEWNIEMTGLIDRLNQPVKKARRPRKKKLEPNMSPCLMCGQPMGEEEFSMFDICLDDGIAPFRQGGYVHFACLNGALHPKYMIQNWHFSDEMLDRIEAKLGNPDG
ncbi:MAG: DUF4259 domain-containing protein [Pseudomonadota bacterium]